MSPHTRQTGQHILILRQLHLRLGIGRAGARHEDIQYESRAVQDTAGHNLLDIARLRGREFVIEDYNINLVIGAIGRNLVQLTRADVDARRRLGQALRETTHGNNIGRLGQKLQLAQELLGLLDRLTVTNDGHNYGTLAQILRLFDRGILFFCHPMG